MTSLKICYGPYEAHGVIKHRVQRLRGLLSYLEEQSYIVDLRQVNFINLLSIEMCDRTIFLADIKNFKFNIYWEDDVVCKRAIDAIKEAESRIIYNRKASDVFSNCNTMEGEVKHVSNTNNELELEVSEEEEEESQKSMKKLEILSEEVIFA